MTLAQAKTIRKTKAALDRLVAPLATSTDANVQAVASEYVNAFNAHQQAIAATTST